MWYIRRRNAVRLHGGDALHQPVYCWYVDVAPFQLADVHFVADDVVWVWYYDRQGCIQSQGINFFKDLPSFLVLLYALQRLTLEQWGLNPSLDERVRRAHFGTFDRGLAGDIVEPNSTLTTKDGKKFELTREVFHSNLGIIGRGTVTVRAKIKGGPTDKTYAVKISWPEESRLNEAEILNAAMEKAGGDPDITNHIPKVFVTQDFPICMGTVRTALGIPARKEGHPDSRVLRVIVFPYLRPITSFKRRFLRSWLECVRCACYKIWHMRPRLSFIASSR